MLTHGGEGPQIEYKTCTEEISENENVQVNEKMTPSLSENVTETEKKSKIIDENVHDNEKMSKITKENVQDETELTADELDISLTPKEGKRAIEKKNRRRQAIIGLIAKDSQISLEFMAYKLDVNLKTIWRDINELRTMGIIERIGEDHGGEWKICKKWIMITDKTVPRRKELFLVVISLQQSKSGCGKSKILRGGWLKTIKKEGILCGF